MNALKTLTLTFSLAALAAPVRASDEPPALKDVFKDDFHIGVALGEHQILGKEPGTLGLVARQFNAVTAENVMKWAELQPVEGEYDWAAADAMVDFAADNDMYVTGHTLLWHQQTPEWVFQDADGNPASRELLLQRLENHIQAVVGRYKDRVRSWDVVNEAVNDDGSMRDTPWYRILGEDYVTQAFRLAAEADPTATLLYNDYSLFVPAKRDGVVRLMKQVQAAGVKVDGVGLQGHYGLDHPEDMQDLADSIEAFAALGLDSSITELDIAVLPFPSQDHWGADLDVNMELNQQYNPYTQNLPDDIAAAQAERFRLVFEVLLAHADTVERVTFWGVHDGHSWKNGWPMAGRTDYPLLFDRQLQPKPAFWSVVGLKGVSPPSP
ncbi:endo-1,4-beta-xylanase [Marinihelvus fidelis]|uniref:Beta-xylanase n=1 Tax=Marinihelvus fidelis TaxID=2613842 RepID=A0A5N0TD77_9GAMM|nr:endo-1,4-beta-xylanase [Marinihelvus fidelis]KAA9132638.1 endo-1,4-beta-xylanase [Marinihelvus fidelis]